MQQTDSINSCIRSFIVRGFPRARKRAINDDTLLLGSGIIDSLGMLTLVDFLEQSFMIHVCDDDLTPDNFANVKCLVSFVEKKKGRVEVLAE